MSEHTFRTTIPGGAPRPGDVARGQLEKVAAASGMVVVDQGPAVITPSTDGFDVAIHDVVLEPDPTFDEPCRYCG